jgi:hypothetical protein
MPALDSCHENIVRALEKAGWTVEFAPYKLQVEQRTAYVNLAVARNMNGSRQQMLLVEVKCFPDKNSTTRELYTSIGQYLVYCAMLIELDLPFPLYLAIPEVIFKEFFDASVMRVIADTQIKLAIVNLESEAVVQWIN